MNTTFKLDPELKQRWVSALRSGKYHQGHGCLRDIDNNYCCLGVLADLIDPEAWSYTPEYALNSFKTNLRNFTNSRNVPKFKWNPTNSEDPTLIECSNKYLITDIIPTDIQRALAIKNDFHMLSFLEIADYIETNL